MRKFVFAAAGIALMASGLFGAVASGADHRDSPLNRDNPTADINDVYAFRSPETAANLVVVLSTNPLIAPSDNATRGKFDPIVQYQLHIDRNADLVDDATVTIRVTSQPDEIIIEGLGAPITAPITAAGATTPVVTTVGGVKIFAGLRDDPFFFDLPAFNTFVASPKAPVKGLRAAGGGDPADAFAGTNIMAVVIEAPVTVFTGGTSSTSGTIKVWASSTKNGQRIDRMGIPAINTALIPTASKDAFNAASPVNDLVTYKPVAVTSITGLRTAVDNLFTITYPQDGGPLGLQTADAIASVVIPDVVTIDFSKPVQFPNGRRLQDDVIDTELGLILNRGGPAGISDGVNANDKTFGTAFPYAADPVRPAATTPATTPGITPPNTGDAGLFSDSGTMWAASAAFFVLAVGLGGAGALSAMRSRSR